MQQLSTGQDWHASIDLILPRKHRSTRCGLQNRIICTEDVKGTADWLSLHLNMENIEMTLKNTCLMTISLVLSGFIYVWNGLADARAATIKVRIDNWSDCIADGRVYDEYHHSFPYTIGSYKSKVFNKNIIYRVVLVTGHCQVRPDISFEPYVYYGGRTPGSRHFIIGGSNKFQVPYKILRVYDRTGRIL